MMTGETKMGRILFYFLHIIKDLGFNRINKKNQGKN